MKGGKQMKTDLLKKLLNELGIEPIAENNVQSAMKKAVNNSIYWFCFKHKSLIENIHSVASILAVACVIVLFFAGAFISTTSFLDWFMKNHIGIYLFLILCATCTVIVMAEIILGKITSWNEEIDDYGVALNSSIKKIYKDFNSATGYNSRYFGEGLRLFKQRINKTLFIFARDRNYSRCYINISEIES